MAKRKLPRDRRIRKLYELAINALALVKCCFCKQPLLLTKKGFPFDADYADGYDYIAWMNKVDKSSILKVTVHHANEERSDNTKQNRRWCHQSCHKSFHMRQGHQQGRFTK